MKKLLTKEKKLINKINNKLVEIQSMESKVRILTALYDKYKNEEVKK